MKVILPVAIASLLLASGCSSLRLEGGHSTVLPPSAARAVTEQCSRASAPAYEGTWTPSVRDIEVLEARLPRLRRLHATCCIGGWQVESLHNAYLQYVGLVVGGKKLIYVNAFRAEKPPPAWRIQPELACDGGSAFWGVVYDPASGRFTNLSVNGLD